jgi:serine protease inhibitor
VWPLLAILADVADPSTSTRLKEALGLTNGESFDFAANQARPVSGSPSHTKKALELVKFLAKTPGLNAAAGVWVAPDVNVLAPFVASLPGMVQFLSGNESADKIAIAQWANKVLRGAIPGLNVGVEPDTGVYLASAVIMRTAWEDSFVRDLLTGHLRRYTAGNGLVRASPDVTVVSVHGSELPNGHVPGPQSQGLGAHDVYVVLGREGASPRVVLALGLEAVRKRGAAEALSYTTAQREEVQKRLGPGLSIDVTESTKVEHVAWVNLTMPSFRITSDTQFGAPEMEAFGLKDPADNSDEWNQFPGISKEELSVNQGGQQAMAEFGRHGFVAAAYTELHGPPLAARAKKKRVRSIRVTINLTVDRAFGFIAVEPRTGLLLFMGWASKEEWTKDDQERQETPESDSDDQSTYTPNGKDRLRGAGQTRARTRSQRQDEDYLPTPPPGKKGRRAPQ